MIVSERYLTYLASLQQEENAMLAVIEQEAMLNAAKVLIRMFMVFIYSKLR